MPQRPQALRRLVLPSEGRVEVPVVEEIPRSLQHRALVMADVAVTITEALVARPDRDLVHAARRVRVPALPIATEGARDPVVAIAAHDLQTLAGIVLRMG